MRGTVRNKANSHGAKMTLTFVMKETYAMKRGSCRPENKANLRREGNTSSGSAFRPRTPGSAGAGRPRVAQVLRGRARRDAVEWARSLGVARPSQTRYLAFGDPCQHGGPERKPSEPDQDRRSIDRQPVGPLCLRRKAMDRLASNDESLPAGAIFLLARGAVSHDNTTD